MVQTANDESPDSWIAASEAYGLVSKRNGGDPALAICTRANAGMVQTKAALFRREHPGGYSGKLVQDQRDSLLPEKFWWARGHEALEQDWLAGDFSTWIDKTYLWQAFGVQFARDDIVSMLAPAPALEEASPAAPTRKSAVAQPNERTRGRGLSHDHPYAAASTALRLAALPTADRNFLTDQSVGKEMEAYYRASGARLPHEDSLDDYGKSVLRALREYWGAQGR